MFILFFGQPPFNKADPVNDRFYSLLVRKQEHFFRLHPTVKRISQELNLETLEPSFLDLLSQLLSRDLDRRPTSVEQVLAHKFFSAA